jgi:hypothetical protein
MEYPEINLTPSKEKEETTQLVNNDLTERVASAFLANGFVLLNSGPDNVIMINAKIEGFTDGDVGASVDVLITLKAVEEMVNWLKTQIEENKSQ